MQQKSKDILRKTNLSEEIFLDYAGCLLERPEGQPFDCLGLRGVKWSI